MSATASATVRGVRGVDVTVIALPTTTVDAIAAATRERDEGWKAAEEADRTGWDKSLIDRVIDELAATGLRFSANQVRELVPANVRATLMGSRFHAALQRGVIRFVGFTPSTKKSTHNKRISLYEGKTERTHA